jgi:alkanesulfonate monooxygenase SsuD/methylene tetrahydromethanopterin reductase-like flavin-dependent oxidoreductase (luciferase family)
MKYLRISNNIIPTDNVCYLVISEYYFYYYLVIYQTYSMILIFIYNSHFRQLKTLAFATANTNQIALGTRVIKMLFHGPVMLARRFATLDLLSQDKVF